jgi:hypothetical protein
MEVDPTRAFRRPHDLLMLVQAILAGDIGHESDWVEWKGPIDLYDSRWAGGIARQILGFANRDPAAASVWADGCGYFVAGVEPNQLSGVTVVDTATLDTRLSRYLGDRGPHWSANYVGVSERSVLVIIIEPPRQGDPIFTLQQTFEDPERKRGYSLGDIFVRRRGRTDKASPQDIERLTREPIGKMRSEESHSKWSMGTPRFKQCPST